MLKRCVINIDERARTTRQPVTNRCGRVQQQQQSAACGEFALLENGFRARPALPHTYAPI